MWNLKEFERVYDRYQNSGLQVKDFCINECISEGKFYYWQRKVRRQERQQPGGFVPIVFNAPATAACNNAVTKPVTGKDHPSTGGDVLEIVYPNNVVIRVPCGTAAGYLQSLVFLNR